MFQHFYLVPTFLENLAEHWGTLVSGALSFLLALWFARKGKIAGFRVLIGFAVVCLFIAVYMTWEAEYEKNAGYVEIQYYLPYVQSAGDDLIDTQVIVTNTTQKPAIFRELGMGRVIAVDKSPNLADQVSPYCKEIDRSPQINRSPMALNLGSFMEKVHDNVYFTYLTNDKIDVVVESGKAMIIRIDFRGEAVDTDKFNAIALCPSVVYLDAKGSVAAAICEGSTLSISLSDKGMRAGPDTRRFRIFPDLQLDHCRSVYP